MSRKRVFKEDEIEDFIGNSFKKFNLQEHQYHRQRALVVGDYFLLENTQDVEKYFTIFEKLLHDFKKTKVDGWYTFIDKYIEFRWSTDIDAEVRNLNMNLIANSPESNYNKAFFGEEDEDLNSNPDKNRILIEYFTNLFNTVKAEDVGSLLNECILEEYAEDHQLLVVNSSFFDTLKVLGYIGNINMNVQVHIALTDGVLNNNSLFINNDNKNTVNMKYDYGLPVETLYMTEGIEGSEETGSSFVKKVFFPNGNIKTYEENSLVEEGSHSGNHLMNKMISYEKYEKNASDQYNGIYLKVYGYRNVLTTRCTLYKNGRVVSYISY